MRLFIPYLAVFVSGLCVMVVELVAGRIIARHLGASIYTWTSVIGIILAGIAAGNYLGGRIADRYPPYRSLSLLFLICSVVAISIPFSERIVAEWIFLWTLDWPVRVSLHVAAVFLIPSLLMGTVSPIAAKAALGEAQHTGRALGSIYAWGVIGSILGTFLTGFYLIPTFGANTAIWLVVILLAAMSLIIGGRALLPGLWLVVMPMIGVLQWAPWAWAESTGRFLRLRPEPTQHVVEVESLYSHIRVLRSSNDGVERLHLMLDKMTHNTVVVGEPLNLQDPYIRMFSGLTHRIAAGRDRLTTVTIGGGGYAFPQYLHHFWPEGHHDVVEIDPEVTRIAAEFMQVSMEGLTSYHEDGRVFVNRLVREKGDAARGMYDFVYHDAFNDYSVPYQLTTREFFEGVRTILKPSGAILMNMIDAGDSGLLLGALINTLGEVFPHVEVFMEGTLYGFGRRNTFVLCASTQRQDFSGLTEREPGKFGIHRLSSSDLRAVLQRTDGLVLTDAWAPTENLVGPVVRQASKGLASGALVHRGVAFLNEGELNRAESAFERVLSIDDRSHEAHRYLGYIYETREDWNRSRAHYRQSLDIEPAQRSLCIELALSAEERGRPDEARAYLQTALSVNPDDVEIRFNLGISFAMQGQLEDAVAELDRVKRSDPEHFGVRTALARAFLQAGDYPRAAAELEVAERLSPGDPGVQAMLRQLRSAQK